MAAQTEITLSQSDIRRLKKLGYTDKDVKLMTFALSDLECRHDGLQISTDKAMRLLGREKFISGVGRCIFHWTAKMECKTNCKESVTFMLNNETPKYVQDVPGKIIKLIKKIKSKKFGFERNLFETNGGNGFAIYYGDKLTVEGLFYFKNKIGYTVRYLGYTIYADIELNTLSVDDNKGVNVYQWSLYED